MTWQIPSSMSFSRFGNPPACAQNNSEVPPSSDTKKWTPIDDHNGTAVQRYISVGLFSYRQDESKHASVRAQG
jgi:hypothetical protein